MRNIKFTCGTNFFLTTCYISVKHVLQKQNKTIHVVLFKK